MKVLTILFLLYVIIEVIAHGPPEFGAIGAGALILGTALLDTEKETNHDPNN